MKKIFRLAKKIIKKLAKPFEKCADKKALKARRRFIAKMNAKCDELGITDYIIESAAGVSLGGEVENEQLGRGFVRIPVEGLIKIMISAISYDFLIEMWKHKDYVIKTKENQEIFLERSLDEPQHGVEVVSEKYEIIGWKTGSSPRNRVSNLVCAVKSEAIKDKILVGIVSCSTIDTLEHNRGKAMRALLDIGQERLLNPMVDINALQQQLSENNVSKAMVVELSDDGFKNLYCNGDEKSSLLTMSMIKILTAQVVLDNIKDLDQYVKITKADIRVANAKFFSGSVFSAGQIVTYRDLLYAMMFPSSCQAAFILARSIGEKLK